MRDMTEQIIRMANLNSRCSIMDYEEMSLSGLIDEAIRMNEIMIRDRNISFEISVPSHLSVRVSKIFGVTLISNLINNAVKYNFPSGRVIITAVEGDTGVSLSIEDTGIGMEPNTLENIWDEFYIHDSARRDPVSKGLGLSMVKNLVILHGGDITASSPGIGKGSIFVITFSRACRGNRICPVVR